MEHMLNHLSLNDEIHHRRVKFQYLLKYRIYINVYIYVSKTINEIFMSHSQKPIKNLGLYFGLNKNECKKLKLPNITYVASVTEIDNEYLAK